MADIKTIGVLTSGGDCAGLNAAIRAVTDHATRQGWRVLGLRNGHLGLLENPPLVVELTRESVRGDLFRRGGTTLGTTTKGDPFAFPQPDGSTKDVSDEVIAAIRRFGIDALVVIAGDGSFRLFDRLCRQGNLRWVGIPKTIDNDVQGTDFAIGFYTAVEVVGQACDRLASTAASHRRIMVLEVMGRDSGFIALFGGVSGGANVILMPEFPYSLQSVADHILHMTRNRPSPVLMVVAEGVKRPVEDRRRSGSIGLNIAEQLQKITGYDARCTVLGHLQRGGGPAMFDRMLASAFGVQAVEMLKAGKSTRMAAYRGGIVTDIPLDASGPRFVSADAQMLTTARSLGIFVGDVPDR